jgi:CPA2 family monovalent cation:H+ antiporter-2
VRLRAGSPAVGKTLADIDLRALTGASVITILRGTEGLRPTGREELRDGDVLALAGTHDSIRSATAILEGREI